MKRKFEYSSRFRILKGGRVSLIISALVTSVTLSLGSPVGGVVTSGDANISYDGKITNIKQSTQKASINWEKFNLKIDETVNFKQPNINSITLNRIIGNERSVINGALNANGQVWILNSNGVLFGKNAKVNTSGLLATTKKISDEDFQKGNYKFSGDSIKSIENEGTIKVKNKGYVVFASNETINSGSIEAVKAKIHLIGAKEYSIKLEGNSLVELTIEKGVMDALVENSGAIINEAGEVYLTTNAVDELLKGVVNHTGIIEANSLDELTGKVELYAHGGKAEVGGSIEAIDGFVETSGKEFTILDDKASIKAGKWLIDPTNLIISPTISLATQGQLNNGDVELQADEDIYVYANITWSTDKKLTLTAGDEIYVNATIENTNDTNGGVYFNAADTTDKVIFETYGKVIINNIYQLQWLNTALAGTYELGSNIDASVTSSWNSGEGFNPIGDATTEFTGTLDGNNYTIDSLYINRSSRNRVGLFGRVESGSTISNLGLTNVDITGDYKVGGLCGVSNEGTISNSYVTGSVTGNDYVGGLVGVNDNGTITNSYATGSVDGQVGVGGLVGYNVEGTITNSYATGSVSGNKRSVGGLVGWNNKGTITNSYATGSVSGSSFVGGLVGRAYEGTLTNSYATGSVDGDTEVGGLIGYHIEGTITNSYATGSVSGDEFDVGGLVGWNDEGTIINSYATGSVSGTSKYIGGLVGYSNGGGITNSYWNIDTSGQTKSSGGGTGLTTAQFADPTYFSSWNSDIWQLYAGGSSIEGYEILSRPYLKDVTIESDIPSYTTLFESGWGREDSPYTISTWAQLANIDYNSETLSFYYDLINNLTTSTSGYSAYASEDANDGEGWTPIGSSSSNSFTGDFDGLGHTISNLYINTSSSYVGLFGHTSNGSSISNLGLIDVNISGNNYVGGLVGVNKGVITNSYVTGSVSGVRSVGGLVGYNNGTITNSYATGSVSGEDRVGGLVGDNYVGTITNSYATGSVSGDWYVGGLVGDNNFGEITNTYATGSVDGDTEVGGLAGENSVGTITNSYSTGSVSGDWGVGGLVGSNYDGTIKNSYWDKQTSGQATSAGGSGLTTEEFKDETNFSTWNSNIWQFSGDGVEGYGFLSRLYLKNVTQENDIPESTRLFNSGYGTESSPYTITSWEQLQNINFNSETLTNQYYYSLSNNLNKLTSGYDIYVSSTANDGKGWNPIGSLSLKFLGNFEGNSYRIDSLYINRTSEDFIGLFSYLSSSTTISNLGVTNANIIARGAVGILAGVNNGTISNAYTTGYVSGTTLVGGLFSANIGTIFNVYSTAEVNGEDEVGGLVGENEGDITNSYATGSVDGTSNVGGLIGYNDGGTITASYWDTETSGQITSAGGTGLTSAQMGYGKIFDEASWDIEVDTSLTSGDAPRLRYNADGSATWIIAPLKVSYGLDNQTLTYNRTSRDLSSFYNNSSSIFGSNYSFIDSTDYSFIDLNSNSISSVRNAGLYTIGLASENEFLKTTSVGSTKGKVTINPKQLAISYDAEDKIYDGNTNVSVTGTLSGVILGDIVSFSEDANYIDKNVGNNKQVNITNIVLNGSEASNYTVVNNDTTNADITAKEITGSYSVNDKVYDGKTLANVQGSLSGVILGDDVKLTQNANYIDKNVGENKKVTVTNFGISGDDANNYSLLPINDIETTADITPKEVRVTFSAEDKDYDGTNMVRIKGGVEGLIKGDKVSFSSGEGYFIDSNPGRDKTVYINNLSLKGKDSKNYVLDKDTYETKANIDIDLEDILGSLRSDVEEYKVKTHFIDFNLLRSKTEESKRLDGILRKLLDNRRDNMPITKEIILDILNGGVKLPEKEIAQPFILNYNDIRGDRI